MKEWTRGLLMLTVMIGCIFFGISLATQGTQRIHGPLDSTAPVSERVAAAVPASGQAASAEAKTKMEPLKPEMIPSQQEPERSKHEGNSGINRVGNKTGELLQIIAYHGIQAVVGLLDKIFN